jgi:GAF domain-containing protein/anti-sigma regulatory factor (Ser/Thr protein kinase)
VEQSLRLDDRPDAVASARRLVVQALRGTPAEAVSDEAQLVVGELATNALIHGAAPAVLHVRHDGTTVRLEVADRSRLAPLQALVPGEAMTGRGLSLVQAVSQRWGVEPRIDGKVVWAELSADPAGRSAADVTEPAGAANQLDDGPWSRGVGDESPRYRVTLGDVPTDLLLAAKAHVDGLVREFTLAATGAASGHTAEVTPALARLIETVTTQFAEARQAIKRQAVAAAAAGEQRTRLTLNLPLSAAEAGRDYLAALDEADAYARAARVLTVESPPEHRAFRQWYVAGLIEQLGAAGRGEPPVEPVTFEQFLLSELASVAAAHRVTDRAARLQAVTAALAGATVAEEVADAVVSQGVDALGASGGALMVAGEGEHLGVAATVGYSSELVARLRAERRDAPLPAATALRTGQPVWLESREQRESLFPALTGLEPGTTSMCTVPLLLPDQVVGVLRFSFTMRRLFGADERAFVEALAGQAAQALARTQLAAAERTARREAELAAERLSRLHRVTAALASASDTGEIAEIVARESAETLGASLSVLSLLDDDDDATLRVVRVHGGSGRTARAWSTFPVHADLPASEAFRTQTPVVLTATEQLFERYPLLAGEVVLPGSLACVPLLINARALGTLTLSFPPEHVIDAAEVDVLTTIGRQCGLALERARLFDLERRAKERSAFLADATARLAASLEPAETLGTLVDLVVPALADWAVVFLTDAEGHVDIGAVRHRDADVTDYMRTEQAHTIEMSAKGGLGEVIRSGRSVRYETVPDSLRARIDDRADDEDLAARIAPSTALAAPLSTGGRVLGAIALARTDGAAYTADDLMLVEDVAARAAVAVGNAARFGRERDAALTLQRSLLPQQLPRIEGMSFAWRYLPGSAGTHIGGDWYDVIPLEQGRVALVIGDVMGRGLRAAAVMGQLRATARAHASAELSPAEVLHRLDAAVVRLEQEQITTALFALLDPVSRTVTIASAGHLPPLVTAPGVPPAYLDVEPGPPLGADSGDYPQTEVVLPEGATLLLFTDGLVEDRRLPVETGLATLLESARSAATPEELCDRALVALGRDVAHDDDTAILAVGLVGPAAQVTAPRCTEADRDRSDLR